MISLSYSHNLSAKFLDASQGHILCKKLVRWKLRQESWGIKIYTKTINEHLFTQQTNRGCICFMSATMIKILWRKAKKKKVEKGIFIFTILGYSPLLHRCQSGTSRSQSHPESRAKNRTHLCLLLSWLSLLFCKLRTQQQGTVLSTYMPRLPASISTMKTISQKRPWSNQVSTGTLVKMFS